MYVHTLHNQGGVSLPSRLIARIRAISRPTKTSQNGQGRRGEDLSFFSHDTEEEVEEEEDSLFLSFLSVFKENYR